jgi:DNA polymerase-3 subunit alpha
VSALTEPAFVHLRVRSCFSLLESTVRIPNLLDRCRASGLPAVAVVDKANLFNALAFSQAAAKAGIQPIVGCLLPITDHQRPSSGRPSGPTWMPIYAQNERGYLNLLKLLSIAHLESETGLSPEIGLDDLEAHADDLILLSGGPKGRSGERCCRATRNMHPS